MIIIYFFQFSSALLWKPFCFYCRISFLWICCLCSTCCTETFQRKQEFPLLMIIIIFFLLICLIPTVLSSWYPLGLTISLLVNVAVKKVAMEPLTALIQLTTAGEVRRHTQLKRSVTVDDALQKALHTPTGGNLQHLAFSLNDILPCVDSFWLILQTHKTQCEYLLFINVIFYVCLVVSK